MTERASFSLTAYRAIARRTQRADQDFDTPRPPGRLIWCHLGHPQDRLALLSLADRLRAQDPTVTVLLTLPPKEALLWQREPQTDACLIRAAPDEHPASARAFLAHWAPDIALWFWGGLRPTLIDETAQRGIPLHLVHADAAGFDAPPGRWLPDLPRQILMMFRSISARSQAARQRLERLGVAADSIAIEPPLRPCGPVLPCVASDLTELSRSLAGRPVWLAAQCRREELRAVLSAHRHALSGAHRLLLVVEPAEPGAAEDFLKAIEDQGFTCAVWSNGDWPETHTAALLADAPGELGLWYRLATVAFLGSSLIPDHGGTDPMAAAALGTAILYGPNVRRHLPAYSRLAARGAARIVNDGESLGAAVSHLLNPDQAAAMAHAGWDVVTEGAQGVDRVVKLVQDSLDEAAAESAAQ